MDSKTNLRESVLRAREKLKLMREKLHAQHQTGSPAIQVCNRLSNVFDDIVVEIFDDAINDIFPNDLAIRNLVSLVPHGGYGRRELSPYSDLDLMLLYEPRKLNKVSAIAKRLVEDINDLGVDLGFSLRTINQCISMSSADPIILTSLMESRHLAGNMKLFSGFMQKFKRHVRRRVPRYLKLIDQSRREEHSRHGETMHLLEPNVKRSKGGLRDLQLLRWIGFVRYEVNDLDALRRRGHLETRDFRELSAAKDFLLRLRNELHFHAKSERDILDRSEQKRIAEAMGYKGEEGFAPVEQFMQQYFRHTSAIRHGVGHFVAGARWSIFPGSNSISLLFSKRSDDDFLIGPVHVRTTKKGLEKVTSDLIAVLRLFELANQYNRRIDHPTWEAVREAITSKENLRVDPSVASQFLSLLSHTNQLGKLIRRLHEIRVLEKLVPGFDHARCLLQFNEYHKYTVDEHSIRAVECANEFRDDHGIIGQTYRDIQDKSLFHLALLVHDLGKGFVEDHSDVGARIAVDVAEHLFLSDSDAETLRFLVHKHLMLSHLAFRRDSSDAELVREHATEIGTVERLKMLFVLTCADFASVGPGVLNQWKSEVLSDLFLRLKQMMDGTRTDINLKEIENKLRSDLIATCNLPVESWLANQINHLPLAFLEGPSSDKITDDLTRLEKLGRNKAVAWGRYIESRQVVEYTISAYEDACPGAFHKITGALTGKGLEILAAEIHNLAEGLFLDRFYVHDSDFAGQPPEHRNQDVTRAIEQALASDKAPKFRNPRVGKRLEPLTDLPTEVRIRNSTSSTATLIEVTTHDKPGLLHTISQTLFELDLSISNAKISTNLDRVVDVFYVTDSQTNEKIEDEDRIAAIQARLHHEITEFSLEATK